MCRSSSPRNSCVMDPSEVSLRERRTSTPATDVFYDIDFTVGCDTVDSFMIYGKTKNVEVVETYAYKMVKEGAKIEYTLRYTPVNSCFPHIPTWMRLYVHTRRHVAEIKKMCKERSRSRHSFRGVMNRGA